MGNLQTIVMLLPKLDASGLAQVALKVKALQALTGAAATPDAVAIGDQEDYLLYGIIHELKRRGLIQSYEGGVRASVTKRYTEESADIRSLLNLRLGELPTVEMYALGRMAIRELARYQEARDIPISGKMLINSIGLTITAIEASFPGYLEAGLLPATWRIDKNGGRKLR